MCNGIYGGIEGGGSKSFLTLIRGDGKTLCCIDGPASNHWSIGMEKCSDVMYDIIQEGFIKCGLDKNTKLEALGLSLSGCEEEATNLELKTTLLRLYPDVAKSVSIASDTIGSILTASPNGGIVLIAGTGSNSLLLNEDGSIARCGGWGHIIGDEGGALWISVNAVRHVFNAEDNFNVPVYDYKPVKRVMCEHFKISKKEEMLKHCYSEFSKPFFAAMCEKLAKAANEEKDPLCCDLFRRAGKDLGTYVQTLSPKIKIDYSKLKGGLPIVCVGSVFKSWNLLRDGFLEGLNGKLSEFTLLRLKVSAAVGAAYLGARESAYDLPIKFQDNVEVMFHHEV